jgi:hypothetical protein
MNAKSVFLAYYSHSKRKFNTQEEKEELDYIERIFSGIVICPNRQMGPHWETRVYLDNVSRMDAVYVSQYVKGVGKGVYEECKRALKLNIPVYVIFKGSKDFFHLPVKDIKRLPDSSNWDFYGELIIDYSPIFQYLNRFENLMRIK